MYSKKIKDPKIYLHTLETVASRVDSLHIFVHENQKKTKKVSKRESQSEIEEPDPFEFIREIISGEKNKKKNEIVKVQKCR